MDRRLKVLISAYACEPGKGSEPEVGWQWAVNMARLHDVTVITRSNNQSVIEAELADHRRPLPKFVYYDLPKWMRFWKTGSLGVQIYYALWQRGVLGIAEKLHRRARFDLMHHVTFGTFSMPSALAKIPIPLIMGPVGGGESTPPGFRSTYSLRGQIAEILRNGVRRFAVSNPFLKRALKRTHTLIAATPQTAHWLEPVSNRPVLIEPQCGITESDLELFSSIPIRRSLPFRLISVSRLVHWKGIHLALHAYARFAANHPDSEYWIVSTGPEENRLKKLALKLGIESRVQFLGRLPDLKAVYGKLGDSDVFIHPALHEGFGYACLEALAAGRPVLCLDWGGPALQVTPDCGYSIRVKSPEQVIRDLALAMGELHEKPERRIAMGETARIRAASEFHWSRKSKKMDAIYRGVFKGEHPNP